MRSAAVKEHVVLLAGLDIHVVAVVKPEAELPYRIVGDGHEALLTPLAYYPDEAVGKEKVGQLKVDKLAHAQPAAEQHLYDCLVALALPLAQVYRLLKPVNLVGGQHLGQMLAQLRRLEQLGGIVIYESVRLQELVERPHAAQYPALRARANAQVVQTGGKITQVGQRGGRRVNTSIA